MKRPSEKEVAAVLGLPGPKRYAHFIKVVADRGEAWCLDDDGWAMVGADGGEEAIAIWPARRYAELCATSDWAHFVPERLALGELLERVIPSLREQGRLVAVFPTPDGAGVLPPLDVLDADLRDELSKIE